MHRWATMVIVLACAGFASAADVYVTPEQAAEDPDFAVQGEYRGELVMGDQKKTIAIQVIALGDGKFRMVPLLNGLPGDSPDVHKEKPSEASIADGKVKFMSPDGDDGYVLLAGDKAEFFPPGSDKPVATLTKVHRESKTLGKKAPEGAVVLFDGSEESVKNWHGGGAKLSEDGYLQQGIKSKELFGDFTLHIEFRLPYKPKARGQGRGNSGLYMQGRYEVQMLDSFGLEGLDNECGGIYKIARPAVNMCYPPLSWQTYDIEFTAAKFDADGNKTANARATVYHNGVKIHDDVELTHATTASPTKEGPEPGMIYLQDHGNPVRYRNIWLLPKSN